MFVANALQSAFLHLTAWWSHYIKTQHQCNKTWLQHSVIPYNILFTIQHAVFLKAKAWSIWVAVLMVYSYRYGIRWLTAMDMSGCQSFLPDRPRLTMRLTRTVRTFFCKKLTTSLLESAGGREWLQKRFHDHLNQRMVPEGRLNYWAQQKLINIWSKH